MDVLWLDHYTVRWLSGKVLSNSPTKENAVYKGKKKMLEGSRSLMKEMCTSYERNNKNLFYR